MDLIAFVRILRRRWPVLVALTAVGLLLAGTSWVLQRGEDSFYRATHTLVSSGVNVNLPRAAAVAVTGDVPERVAARLPGSTAAELAAQITVVPRTDVGFLDITAVGTDPGRTVAVADAFAEELATYMARLDQTGTESQVLALQSRIDQLMAEVTTLDGQLAAAFDPAIQAELTARTTAKRTEAETLTAQLDSLREASLNTTTLQTFATAEPVAISGPQFRALFTTDGTTVGGPDPAAAIAGTQPLGLVPRLLLGGTFGLLAGVATALVLERLDPRLRTKAAAEEVYGWPVITEVPPLSRDQQHDKAVLASSAPRSRTAEAYRVLRSSVLLAGSGVVPVEDDLRRPDRVDGDGLVVLVTSASPSEGKTTTVANLAAVLGESGQRVLVVNCDFRRPTLGAYLGVDTHLARVVDTDVPNVRLLAQVTDDPEHANPADVIATQHQVIDEARRRFDVVVLDTAPLLTTNDANDVLDAADLVVVVARAGRTTREAADRCAEVLERRRAPVLGVALLAAADAPAGRQYYYGDYYVDDDRDLKHRGSSTADKTEAVLVSEPRGSRSRRGRTTTAPAPAHSGDGRSDPAGSVPTDGSDRHIGASVPSPYATSPVDGLLGTRQAEDGLTPGSAHGLHTRAVTGDPDTPAVPTAEPPSTAADKPAADKHATSKAATSTTAADKPATSKTATDKPAANTQGQGPGSNRDPAPPTRNRSGGGRRRR